VSEGLQSAAAGTPSDGEAFVTLAEILLATAWNVRGDPAQAAFVAEVERSLGVPLPSQPNTSARSATAALLWLGPRAWLLVAGADSPRGDFDDVRRRLNDAGAALFDVSASYVAWSVSGAAASRVLGKGCPLDLHPRAFPAGRCAQSLLGHIHALFYRPDDASTFIVMVARSFAADAWRELLASAACDGYRIDPAAPFVTG
jgi:sarcosine oxidase, subunit gamma